jgi:hypothetical protein
MNTTLTHDEFVAERKATAAARMQLVRAVKKTGLSVLVRLTMEHGNWADLYDVKVSEIRNANVEYEFKTYVISSLDNEHRASREEIAAAMENLDGFEIVAAYAQRGFFVVKAGQ